MLASSGVAAAQQVGTLALDPNTPGQGTTLVVAADQSVLSQNGRPAGSITFALARGMRIDTAAVPRLCARRAAARSACPPETRIGFGLFSLDTRGYDSGAGDTRLTWALDAYLAQPQRSGDAASVVLSGKLLGADLVGALLAPSLGMPVPTTTTTIGRLLRRTGRYGVEMRFPNLPVQLDVAPPIAVTPARLELSLSAVRNVRQNFTRRFKIPTLHGYEIRKIPDHRLVGHYLLRSPRKCKGSWPAELRVGFPGRVARTALSMPCTSPV